MRAVAASSAPPAMHPWENSAAMVDAAFADVEPSRGVQAAVEEGIAGLWKWYEHGISLYAGTGGPGENQLAEDLQHRLKAVLQERLQLALDAETRRLPFTASELVELVFRRFDALAFGARRTWGE